MCIPDSHLVNLLHGLSPCKHSCNDAYFLACNLMDVGPQDGIVSVFGYSATNS